MERHCAELKSCTVKSPLPFAHRLPASFTYARNALNRNLPNSFLKTGKPWIDFSDLSLLPLYQLLDDLLLLLDNNRKLCVGNAGVELTAHECGSLVVLDVAHIFGLGNLDVL